MVAERPGLPRWVGEDTYRTPFNYMQATSAPSCDRAMDGSQGYTAEAVSGQGSFPPSASLPWSQIPKFEPGVTEVRTYERKLSFLREIWPAEQHVGPRAALMVEGASFQKIARLDAEKLRSAESVEYLVTALGGPVGSPSSRRSLDTPAT